MKLNHFTLKYLAAAMLVILSAWAAVFYINILDEVYDSLDDGLDNYRLLIIRKARKDKTVLEKAAFGEGNYEIREIRAGEALKRKDVYKDTLMYMDFENDLEPVRMLTTVFRDGAANYELKIISSMVEEDDLMEDLFYALIWLYVILLTSILLVNHVLLRRTWRPFYAALDRLRDFRLGKTAAAPVGKSNISEFRELDREVTDLLERTNRAYESQKQFLENAAHELQTPLAISLSRLELLAEKDTVAEPERRAIGEVIRTLERMKRLNKSLLLLSRIENRQFAGEEPVDLRAMALTILGEFEDLTGFRRLKVSVTGEFHPVARMNRDLAQIFWTNLLKNAIVHNIEGGVIELIFAPQGFLLRNSGIHRPLAGERLFQRFYQEDTANKNSTGLGLAITGAIAETYDIRLIYSFDGLHQWQALFPAP
ncbi:HAMP domain-containing sensor histidine kinase [Ravibacter arvi]|uniref:histidine kinase n=1 Tax=Ravibacter arvi TaxID=2051041 RepID=A0ABP8M4S4_9BACT